MTSSTIYPPEYTQRSVGDLEPPLVVTLSDDNGVPVNAAAATGIRMIGKRVWDGSTAFDRAPTATTLVGDASVLTMNLEEPDTSRFARIRVEVEVEWTPGRTQTFHPPGFLDVVPDADHPGWFPQP